MKIDDQFLEACENGNLNEAKKMLEKGANLYALDDSGYDALMLACYDNRLSIIKWLLSIPFNINRLKGHAVQASNIAAQTSMNIVKLLLDKGIDINSQDKKGVSPFMELVGSHCEKDKAKFMIEKGADLNMEDKMGWTGLMYASSRDNRWNDMVKFLIEKGAAVNHQSKDGWTPLLLACHDRVVDNGPFKILMEDKNIDVNKPGLHFGWTPLMQAVGSKYFQQKLMVRLLEHGADVNAFMNIIPHKKIKTTDLPFPAQGLYEDINVSDKFQGYTALMWTVKKKRGAETIKLLCDAGTNVNHKSANGDTAISLATIEKTKSLLMKYT